MAKFEPIVLEKFQANARRTENREFPRAVAISFNEKRGRIVIELDNGFECSFPVSQVLGVDGYDRETLASVEIEGAGNAIRFADVDADYSLPIILEQFLGGLEWTRKEARARASRENGKRGGRPRKSPEPV